MGSTKWWLGKMGSLNWTKKEHFWRLICHSYIQTNSQSVDITKIRYLDIKINALWNPTCTEYKDRTKLQHCSPCNILCPCHNGPEQKGTHNFGRSPAFQILSLLVSLMAATASNRKLILLLHNFTFFSQRQMFLNFMVLLIIECPSEHLKVSDFQ